MAGIYIHIPYCRKACSYCDFYFTTNFSSRVNLINAIVSELQLRKNFSEQTIETIYFGGGTPSLLSKTEIDSILNAVKCNYTVIDDAEITLEANPDDLNPTYLQELIHVGINRLSIGLQSFNKNELNEMNRLHSANQGIEAVKNAQLAGFNNITVDLIYGTPWIGLDEWENHIQTVLDLKVQHISCYQLTIEEKTLLHHRLKKHEFELSDEMTEKQFLRLIEMLEKNGFTHYEISNFGIPGFFSRHNSSYWLDKPYLGIGPSAHGYNGKLRYANIPNLHTYIKHISEGIDWSTIEELNEKNQYNDLVLTGLRTIFGVSLPQMERKLNQSFVNYFQRKAQPYLENGQMVKDNYTYKLTEKAFLFADKISSDLFYI